MRSLHNRTYPATACFVALGLDMGSNLQAVVFDVEAGVIGGDPDRRHTMLCRVVGLEPQGRPSIAARSDVAS